MDFKLEVAKLVKKVVKTDVSSILEIPPDPKLGDFALPCFPFAKKLKKSPVVIAKDLASKVSAPFLEKVEVKGPYVNFFIKDALLAKEIFTNLKKFPKVKKEHVVIEMAGPNTNKPLHLGHLRNIFLGQSVASILEFVGNKVTKVDIVNDRGIHICKSMLAYQKWSKKKVPDKKSDHFVGDLYVLYNQHESDATKKEIEEMLLKWEKNDKPTRALWKKLNAWAIKGIQETYKRIGLKFSKVYFESEHYDKGRKLVLDGFKKKLFKKEDGAIIADLSKFKLDKKVLLRANGTTVYVTQDMHLAISRFKDFKFKKLIYVVASEQDYHFKVLFNLLKLLKQPFADSCFHLSYGMVNLPEGKMKSREGTVVDADALLDEMEALAFVEVKSRYKNLTDSEIQKRAKMIGHAALRFFLLKVDAVRDVTFNPKESLSFEGETGPYVQYAHARICSILKKAKSTGKANVELYDATEINLIKKLNDFSSVTLNSSTHLRPHMVAHYVLELAQEFNTYYNSHNILKADKNTKEARLFLINQIKSVLKQGLKLLFIEAPEQM
tara:strand:+ start:85862 stop:87514 length:1653 start_codon:yes stop_codon:yes gene_type:complete